MQAMPICSGMACFFVDVRALAGTGRRGCWDRLAPSPVSLYQFPQLRPCYENAAPMHRRRASVQLDAHKSTSRLKILLLNCVLTHVRRRYMRTRGYSPEPIKAAPTGARAYREGAHRCRTSFRPWVSDAKIDESSRDASAHRSRSFRNSPLHTYGLADSVWQQPGAVFAFGSRDVPRRQPWRLPPCRPPGRKPPTRPCAAQAHPR